MPPHSESSHHGEKESSKKSSKHPHSDFRKEVEEYDTETGNQIVHMMVLFCRCKEKHYAYYKDDELNLLWAFFSFVRLEPSTDQLYILVKNDGRIYNFVKEEQNYQRSSYRSIGEIAFYAIWGNEGFSDIRPLVEDRHLDDAADELGYTLDRVISDRYSWMIKMRDAYAAWYQWGGRVNKNEKTSAQLLFKTEDGKFQKEWPYHIHPKDLQPKIKNDLNYTKDEDEDWLVLPDR